MSKPSLVAWFTLLLSMGGGCSSVNKQPTSQPSEMEVIQQGFVNMSARMDAIEVKVTGLDYSSELPWKAVTMTLGIHVANVVVMLVVLSLLRETMRQSHERAVRRLDATVTP